MICSPSTPSPTPYQLVYDAQEILNRIQPGQDVSQAYNRFRDALWSLIEVANDPNSFLLSWNTVDKFGKAQLLDYQVSGNPDALLKLKEHVQTAVENMPW